MKYNLAKYTQTASNTVEGDISLTTDEVIAIITTLSGNVALPGSGTKLVLDSDLGARAHTDEIQYYFDSPASSGTVASGIKFYYKNESFEVYTGLDTYYNGSYYYTIVSSDSAPRHIRVEHTIVSGTSGYLNGFQILNDDTYVDFGEYGNKTNHNVSLSLENAIVEINEMFVYNSGPAKANAKLIIEPQNTAADDIMSISTTSDGPWYGVYRDDDKITGSDLWESGNMDDIYVDSNVLKLYPNKTVGTYTTRIIKLDEYQNLVFNIMDYSYPTVGSGIVFTDDFTNGNADGQWTEVTNPPYITFTDGRMNMWYPNTRVATTQVLEYGEDWLFQCRFYQTRYCNLDIYVNDTSGAGLLVRVQTGTSNDRKIQLITAAGTKYNWDDDVAVQAFVYQKWTWVTIQQNFNTLSFKMWNDGTPVASGIEGTYTIPYSEIADTGKIDFRIRNSNYEDLIYVDDVLLIKNYTAVLGATGFISTAPSDTTENIEVRSSNSDPLPRESYIWMSGTYSPAYKYTNHNWIADSTADEQSGDWGTWGRSGNYWEYWYDSFREDEYIIDKPFYTAGNTTVYFKIRRKDGTLYSATISNTGYTSDCFYSTYKVLPTVVGGFWINFFLARGNINNGIYYLRYYNSTLGLVYDRQANSSQGTFMYDMDVVYETNHLWYTDRDISTVFKINTDGTILTSYLATQDIRGIVALPDGGCWFIQQEALIRLDTNGQYVEDIELPTPAISYIYSDLDGEFWLQEGDVIYHMASDGTIYFSVTIPNLYHIIVISSGLLTKQHDGSTTTPPQASYVSKVHKRIIRTWNYPQNEGGYEGTFDTNRYGVRSHTYDDLADDHASHFPIAADTGWDNSEWTTVSLRDYNFTNEQYHQIRFTLRAETSWNSPEVYGLWTQRAIEIPNIYPDNYGEFYLKSDVTYLNPQDVGDYTSKIRAYWLLNTE